MLRIKKSREEAVKKKEASDALKAHAAKKEAERLKNRNILDNPEVDDDLDLHHNFEEEQPESKRRKKRDEKEKEEQEGKNKERKKRKDVSAMRKEINNEVKVAKTDATGRWKGHLATKNAKAPVRATIEVVGEAAEARKGAGYDKIHPSHKRYEAGGEIIFCWHCGYWMKNKSQKLQDRCDMSDMSTFQKHMRSKLRQGLYPQKKNGEVKSWKNGTSTDIAVLVKCLDPA